MKRKLSFSRRPRARPAGNGTRAALDARTVQSWRREALALRSIKSWRRHDNWQVGPDLKGKIRVSVVSLAGYLAIALLATSATSATKAGLHEPAVYFRTGLRARAEVRSSYGSLPLSFEPNEGQTASTVQFLSHGPGYTLFLTDQGAVLVLKASHTGAAAAVVSLTLVGAKGQVEAIGKNKLPGNSNYFIGNDPRHWRTGIPNFAQVDYEGMYRGIGVEYYGRQGELENNFTVAAGVDPGGIRIRITGAERLRLSASGTLTLETKAGVIKLHRPIAYQGTGKARRRFAARYVRRGADEVGFDVTGYSRVEPLVIDPVLSYSTYLGGTGGDAAYGIAVDGSGDAFVTGSTGSTNFPNKSAAQSTPGGDGDAFVAELNPAGSALLYSTYLGGNGVDSGQGIAIDSSGDAYVTGTTASSNFPVTSGAYQTTYGGGNSNAFVTKLGPTGATLGYATYLGGNAADYGLAIAVDKLGDAYVTGSTSSPNFRVSSSPFQIGNDGCTIAGTTQTCTSDAFVTELNPAGASAVYSTYLGGSAADSGQAIAVDAQGYCYVAGYTYSTDFPLQAPLQSSNQGGSDGFITELKPGGSGLAFSTYWGGTDNDQILGLALDSAGNIYVTGQTNSADFPTAGNAYQASYAGNGDAFLSKFASPDRSGTNGSTKVFSTYLGGSQADQGNGIAVDSSGDSFVVGYTQSSDFPPLDPMQTIPGISGAGSCGVNTTCSDAFVTEFGPSGAPVYSTYLGGSQNDRAQAVALDSSGLPYLAGSTDSSNFPVISGALQSVYAGSGTSGNAFIAKVSPSDAPGVALTPQSVNFGNQTVGQTSTTSQTVTLINEGSAQLQISGITAAAPFSQTNTCGDSVNASGGTCTITINFTPTVTGAVTNQIAISDNAAGSPQYITLTGNGVQGGSGTLTMTPSKLTFPSEPVGSTSPAQTVDIINASNASVTITAFNLSGQFVQTNNCGATPVVLNAGASCVATIYFAPTSGGAQTGSFSATSNAAGSASVSLTGNGGSLFSLSAPTLSTTVVAGTTTATFTVAASAPPTFTSSISLSCSSSVTCSFNPASIKPSQTSTLTVTKLAASTNPTNFTVTGTGSSQTVSLPLTVFFSDFSLSALPGVGSVTAGASVSYTVTATPLNGFNQVVLLSCGTGMPANTTCTWSPPGITLNGSAAGTSTLTVNTTSQIAASGVFRFLRGPKSPGGWSGDRIPWILAAGLLLLLTGLVAGRRKFARHRAFWLVMGMGILLLTLGAMSCNDLYYQNNINPAPVGTPSGVFKITIVGTLGSNSTVTRSTSVNLSVGPSP